MPPQAVVEAKARFSALLAEVESGMEVSITRRGRTVARLVPEPAISAASLFEPFWADPTPVWFSLVGEELITLEHAYSHKRLRFVVHLCRWRSGEPQPLASQQVRWVEPEEPPAYPFPAANARIIAALQERLGVGGATASSHRRSSCSSKASSCPRSAGSGNGSSS